MRFKGRSVLVTGASLGVGRATAARFFHEGANVVLVARRREPLDEAIAALTGGAGSERLLALPADVADGDALEALVEQTVARFGALHGVVNNAGAHFRGPVESRQASELAAMVDVNLRAPVVLTRLALPHLRAAGGGFVVNVASLAGKLPLDGAATYSATKFGLRAFSLALAEELRGSSITISVVSPGPIDTGFIMGDLDVVDDIVLSQPLSTADEVAAAVLACAVDGRPERELPRASGKLATVGYLLPGVRRLLRPAMSRRGAAQKARLRRERGS